MYIIKTIDLEKYHDPRRYTDAGNSIYLDLNCPTYCVTLYCELEDGEDSQYPLEDLLDKYYINCTDVIEEKVIDGKRILIVEVEGSLEKEENLKNIREVANLVGKRVFTYNEGMYVKLGIE
ncbi:MAG: hypothetical protein PUC65_06490 [Clostridiales bacterium]|nr:hypothetical protein [Clostridiales bacterium]